MRGGFKTISSVRLLQNEKSRKEINKKMLSEMTSELEFSEAQAVYVNDQDRSVGGSRLRGS